MTRTAAEAATGTGTPAQISEVTDPWAVPRPGPAATPRAMGPSGRAARGHRLPGNTRLPFNSVFKLLPPPLPPRVPVPHPARRDPGAPGKQTWQSPGQLRPSKPWVPIPAPRVEAGGLG